MKKLKSLTYLTRKSFFSIFCLLSLGACSAAIRAPSSETENVTRDGKMVPVPGLRFPLAIPACESTRKDLDECVSEKEEELFAEITKISFRFQSAQNPPSESTSQRDFHAKHHACLAAKWIPLEKIPSGLAAGIFAQKKTLPAVIRYSNGSPKSPAGNGLTPPDSRPDARGLAIKVVGVEGDSILEVEDKQSGVMNQDFVLINHPAFFLRKPDSYPQFISLITEGKPFFQIMDPLELSVLKATNRVVSDPTAETYFSQTPYALGAHKVKYRVRPCREETPAAPSEEEMKDPRFLRARVAKKLQKSSVCLVFSVQKRAPQMDVEDAAVEWVDSPFVDVARLQIPKNQDINDPKRDRFCEDISFNPWNSLAENRPAGALNRARLAVYTAISRKRRLENQVPVREPRATDAFFKVVSPLR